MPTPLIPNDVEAAIHAQFGPSTLAHVLHFGTPAATSYADCVAVADMVADWVVNEYAPIISHEILFTDVFTKSRDVYAGFEATTIVNVEGGRVAGIFNLTETLVVRLRTGLVGRSNHGKFYTFPAIPSDRQNNYLYLPDWGTAVLDALVALDVAATAAGYTWVVGSGLYGYQTPITAAATTLKLGIQARRGKPR